MYCANPDFETTEKNKKKIFFVWVHIAQIYTKMGGEVIIQGKPDKNI